MPLMKGQIREKKGEVIEHIIHKKGHRLTIIYFLKCTHNWSLGFDQVHVAKLQETKGIWGYKENLWGIL